MSNSSGFGVFVLHNQLERQFKMEKLPNLFPAGNRSYYGECTVISTKCLGFDARTLPKSAV